MHTQWLIFTVLCIIVWGTTDVLYKKSLPQNDPITHYKSLIWNGIVMAVVGTVMIFFSDTFTASLASLSDNLYLIPVAMLYPIALFFGLKGKQQLDISVVSPLENIDGAMAAIMLYVYFILTGNSDIANNMSYLDLAGTVLIVIGIVALGIQEHRLSLKEKGLEQDKKRHRYGALALVFPLIYNLVDAVSMVMMGITVNETVGNGISDIDFFIFESWGFAAVALVMWLYLLIGKKYLYNPFNKRDITKCYAASCETMGTLFFILAMALNPILTAPVTSSYCIVALVTARIFLKEKLNKRQYLCIALLIVGIMLLGISDLIN